MSTETLEIVEILEGEGKSAEMGDTLDVHYRGSFTDGSEFDSSYNRNQTFTVKLGQTSIIKGFEQGLVGLKKGGKRKVTIPYHLGYGENAYGPIPAKSTLIFELELVELR